MVSGYFKLFANKLFNFYFKTVFSPSESGSINLQTGNAIVYVWLRPFKSKLFPIPSSQHCQAITLSKLPSLQQFSMAVICSYLNRLSVVHAMHNGKYLIIHPLQFPLDLLETLNASLLFLITINVFKMETIILLLVLHQQNRSCGLVVIARSGCRGLESLKMVPAFFLSGARH